MVAHRGPVGAGGLAGVAVAAPDQQPVASGETGEHSGQVVGLLDLPPVGERLAHEALVDQGGRGVVDVGFIAPQCPAELEGGLDEVAHVGLGQIPAGGLWRSAAGVGRLGVAGLQRLHGQVPDAHGVGAGQDLAAEPPGADAPGEAVVGFVEHHDPAAAEAFLHQLLWCPPGRRRHLCPAHGPIIAPPQRAPSRGLDMTQRRDVSPGMLATGIGGRVVVSSRRDA